MNDNQRTRFLKLENYESKIEIVIDLNHCIGYQIDAVDDTLVLFTPYQSIEIVNGTPFYDNWSGVIEDIQNYFQHLIEKQPISII